MAEFVLNKLVRDGIVDFMKAQGQTPVFRLLSDAELAKALLEKIKEETDEALTALNNPKQLKKEVGDILRVADALARPFNIKISVDLADDDGKGGFKKAVFVERVIVPEDSEWAVYYRRDPLRFPEVGIDLLAALPEPKFTSGIYKHYKTKDTYEAIGIARHSETLEPLVVYRPLYDRPGTPDYYVRPYEMFMSTVEYNGKTVPRFTLTGTP